MIEKRFFEQFEMIADAPNAVSKVRALVLEWALTGQFSNITATEWRQVRLDSVADIRMGNSPPGQSYNESGDGVPLINGPVEFSPGPFGLTVRSKFTTAPTKFCKRGNLLICVRGSTTGRTNIAAFDACIGRGVASIDAGQCQAFVNYFIWSQRAKIFALGTGSTFPSVSYENLASLEITIPSFAEQKRIVAKVDELMAVCDQLEAQQQERETRKSVLVRASLARFAEAPTSANLGFLFHKSYHIPPAELRKSILTLAVQGKLVPQNSHDEPASKLLVRLERERAGIAREQGVRLPKNVPPLTAVDYLHDIPELWEWSRIGHLALVIDYGTSHKADNDSSRVPVYRMGNIVGGRLVDKNLKYVDASIDDLPGLYLKNQDILFNRTNSYELVGKAGIYTGPDDTATFASYLIRIRLPGTFLLPAFYSVVMNAPYYRQTQIEPEVVQQCGQANFNGTKLASTVVPVPPLAEQRRIVAKVDQLMALVDELERQQSTSQTTASKLLDAIVHELTNRN